MFSLSQGTFVMNCNEYVNCLFLLISKHSVQLHEYHTQCCIRCFVLGLYAVSSGPLGRVICVIDWAGILIFTAQVIAHLYSGNCSIQVPTFPEQNII